MPDYGLVGKTLTHSYSRLIHQSVENIDYQMISLNEEEFLTFIKEKKFKGVNITLPYKETVIPYLDYISPVAKEIGAINVVVNKGGLLKGYNMDAPGFKDMLSYHNIHIRNRNVLVLGTGGTSRTVNYVLKKMKAKSITFVSREKKDNAITYQEASKRKDINVIVNTTPNGMFPHSQDQVLLNLDDFPKLESVVDVIYNPYRTNILIKAKDRGLKVASGLYMLVSQAIKTLELFFDKKYDKSLYEKIYLLMLQKEINIVLIGMPISGKTTVARGLSKKLNMPFIDIDLEIEKEQKMTVSEIFNKYGEKYFRDLESKKTLECSQLKGYIISTGGGVILREENINALARTGFIFFINRRTDLLKRYLSSSTKRPLLKNKNSLDELYDKRIHLYKKYADYEIDNNFSKKHAIKLIMLALHYGGDKI